MKILTDEDLGRALLNASRATNVGALALVAILVLALLAAFFWHDARKSKAAAADATAKMIVLRDANAGLERSVKNITSLMKVSINARQLREPMRVSGEMLISFAGEVR